ncbi:LPS export ABC transporter ATP-binding protein [Candidatus Poribacteria bacterium]|nr:LPS export ABC transporter ATP-binding protein [Candidatus Poribacteria bacterium]OUT65564.1 MAG: LPS export ABC transporter ATP-binding protein [bacterium TMED15]
MAITLSTENLVKSYSRKGRTVVDQVSISVSTGEIVGLLGPNGAGKSTTFYMIVGSIRPNSGRIFYNDREITSLPMYQRARLGLGYLPQETSIFRKLTVAENISSVLEVRGLPKGELQKRQNQLMSELGLSSLANQKAYTLSGGECRRAEIARSLAIDPNFMLLDEPFSGIDPIAVQEIKQLVFQLKERGLGILITDHNAAEMLDIVDRAYLITDGKISLSGTPTELLSSQMARERYFGNSFNLPVKKTPIPNSSDETGHTD